MCDTFHVGPEYSENGKSYFAKNSDREPGEPQAFYLAYPDKPSPEDIEKINEKPSYVSTSLQTLKKALEFLKGKEAVGALISSPSWLWGAEIGVNLKGVAIGNEAVFSLKKPENNALSGMDILRLALHFSKTAMEALDLIINLIAEFGQGGDGGWKHPLLYHNSFLIQDANEAYVLESWGREWSWERVKGSACLSNTYLNPKERTSSSLVSFKSKESFIHQFFAKGEKRNKIKKRFLNDNKASINMQKIMVLLRNHNTPNNSIKNGMGSICIHTENTFVKSETTASLIVEFGNEPIVWFTGSPHPCLSLFKPLLLDEELLIELGLANINERIARNKKEVSLVKKRLGNSAEMQEIYRQERNKNEALLICRISEAKNRDERLQIIKEAWNNQLDCV